MDELKSLLPSAPWRLGRMSSKRSRERNPYKEVSKEVDKGRFVGRKGFKKPKPKVQRLGSKSRRSWGFKMPKVRIRLISPFKLLAKLRDAYVNMMLSFAGKVSTMGLPPVHPGRRIESTMCIFSEAELMYIEYLKRDTAFMRSIMSQ